jgi:hypothetical protein
MQILINTNNKILNSNDNIYVCKYILEQKSYSEICTAKCKKLTCALNVTNYYLNHFSLCTTLCNMAQQWLQLNIFMTSFRIMIAPWDQKHVAYLYLKLNYVSWHNCGSELLDYCVDGYRTANI